MNRNIIYEYLAKAETGDIKSQDFLCKAFYDNKALANTMTDDFWERIDRLANEGEDYANFIMHCRYFSDPNQNSLAFEYIRKAIRHQQVPLAFLHLGITFAAGLGSFENHSLAFYYFKKALKRGYEEAIPFIDHEYDTGWRDIVKDYNHAIDLCVEDIFSDMFIYNRQIERDRAKKNYGVLSQLRNQIPFLYPDYNQEEGFDDILNNRDTVNADICYALSTSDNSTEFNIDLLENFLQQLFAPIIQDGQLLYQSIFDDEVDDLLSQEEKELLQAYVNFTHSYDRVCKKYKIKKKEIFSLESSHISPYIKLPLLTLIRRQMFRCILSLRKADPQVNTFILHLDDDRQLLTISEKGKNQDMQLLLISFVEYNIDANTLLDSYHSLFRAYQSHKQGVLVKHLNECVKRLYDANIDLKLPLFTISNLPKIEIK